MCDPCWDEEQPTEEEMNELRQIVLAKPWKRQPAIQCPVHKTFYEQGAMCGQCDAEFTKSIGNMEIHDADVAWLKHMKVTTAIN
ncbi:MAG: hypothetical protein WCF26_28610 [Candidatus Sulfotelmatobacter sp.]